MKMNLNALRTFMAVAHHKSFSKAAEALTISQPAISKSVKELERQIGRPLFDRSHQQATLTTSGETLYRHAQRILAIAEDAEAMLAHTPGRRYPHFSLVMGVIDAVADGNLATAREWAALLADHLADDDYPYEAKRIRTRLAPDYDPGPLLYLMIPESSQEG